MCYAVAILCLNSALACGDLLLVSPIIASSPVFSLILGRLVFSETQIDVRAGVSVLFVVAGVVLVSL